MLDPDIQKHLLNKNPQGLIIDTNILILFFIGVYDPSCIKDCKRTAGYTINDFEILKEFLNCFKGLKIYITPHIISEISNLSITSGSNSSRLHGYVSRVVELIKETNESHIEIYSLLRLDLTLIEQFGFTELGLIELSKRKNIPILTDDGRLYNYASGQTDVFNFNHIKFYSLSKNLNK